MSNGYVWANLSNGDKQTCGYIENKTGLKVGSKVEMLDYNSEFWSVDRLGDIVSKEFVKAQYNRGKNFAHSLK